jgi:urease accessory protein
MYDAISRSERALARDRDLQRVDGAARVVFAPSLRELYQQSPCRVLLPRVDGREGAEVVLVNTAGGIAGGDRLRYDAEAHGAARATFTTQAAEKIYRALDEVARIDTRIEAGGGAILEWLPQETIVFDGGRFSRSIELAVSMDARVLALESLVLGRAASGETMRTGEVTDRWRVVRDGRLLWTDTFRLAGEVEALVGRKALLGGQHAFATAIYVGPDAALRLEAARAVLDADRAGATLINGVLICRMLAPDGAALRATILRLLAALRDGAAPPRVWSC